VQKEITVDERGRTSLARVRSRTYDRYTVKELDDGTLILTPISSVEAAVLSDPAVMAAIEAAKTGDKSALRHRPDPFEEER
jgi:hypothetical protein